MKQVFSSVPEGLGLIQRTVQSDPRIGGYILCVVGSPWLRCFKWQLFRWSFTGSSTFLHGESYTCCKRKLIILSKHTLRFVTVRVEGTFPQLKNWLKPQCWNTDLKQSWRKRCKLVPWSLRRIWWLESRWKSSPR